MAKSENISLLVAKAIWPEIDVDTIKIESVSSSTEKYATIGGFNDRGMLVRFEEVPLETFLISLKLGYDAEHNILVTTEPRLMKKG